MAGSREIRKSKPLPSALPDSRGVTEGPQRWGHHRGEVTCTGIHDTRGTVTLGIFHILENSEQVWSLSQGSHRLVRQGYLLRGALGWALKAFLPEGSLPPWMPNHVARTMSVYFTSVGCLWGEKVAWQEAKGRALRSILWSVSCPSPVSTQLLNLTLELTLPSDLKDTDFDCFIQGDNEICLWAYIQLLGFFFSELVILKTPQKLNRSRF